MKRGRRENGANDRRAVGGFHQLTGMWASLYDAGFHGVSFSASQRTCPEICQRPHQVDPSVTERCFASDMAAKRVCDRTGEPYGFVCPFGLYEILAPIRRGGVTRGYLFLGKSLHFGEEAEPRLREILSSFPALSRDAEGVERMIRQLPRHTSEEYDVIRTVMTAFAEVIGNRADFAGRVTSPLAPRILSYLHSHYGDSLTLSSLSLYFHCSTVTLTESFRREYGATVMQTLEEIRLERAKELLRQTDAPVGEIAGLCGYPDAGYFSKRFRKRFGASPLAWREKTAASVLL